MFSGQIKQCSQFFRKEFDFVLLQNNLYVFLKNLNYFQVYSLILLNNFFF